MNKRVGIGITTTPERRALFESTMREWEQYRPDNSVIISYNDASHKGVSHSKNWLLAELEAMECDVFILADNDTWPIHKDWYLLFTESEEQHLLYNFPIKSKGSNDMRVLYQDDKITSYSHTRGCLIYITKKVLEEVGGFDTGYYNGFEHPDLTTRIFNAGLTTHRSMSPVGIEKMIYCLDQDNQVKSSIPDSVRKANWSKNFKLYQKNRNSKAYKEYK